MNKDALMEMGLEEELAEKLAASFEEELGAALSRRDEEHADALRSVRIDHAVGLALSDAHDAAIAAAQIDRDALTLEEDGSVTGLAEQIEALREAKPFLFRGEDAPGIAVGAAPTEEFPGGGDLSLREVIAGRFRTQRG